jgi:hypothetical protein
MLVIQAWQETRGIRVGQAVTDLAADSAAAAVLSLVDD